MVRIDSFNAEAISDGYLIARLTSVEARSTLGGGRRVDAALDDSTGKLQVFCAQYVDALEAVEPGSAIECRVRARELGGRRFNELSELYVLDSFDVPWHAGRLMPHEACPVRARDALARLDRMFDSLGHAGLRRFLGGVLSDDALLVPFLTSRASRNHHHAYPGGLLVHSVETAMRAAAWSGDLAPDLAELVQVAALLHDIGKIKTVGCGRGRPELGRWVRHEDLTLEILAGHLAQMERHWPQGAALFRHTVTWYRPAKPSGYAKFVGADILRACDSIDTAVDLGKHAPRIPDRPLSI
ncbi:hypothetical protein GCM10028862_03260 [Luteimonas pelagia]